MKGKLIVLDGPDGCGKDTQLELLEKRLKSNGYPAVTTSEPWEEVESGRFIRQVLKDKELLKDPLYVANLFNENRREHDLQFIRPNIEAGNIVLTGRYRTSTLAYQKAQGAKVADLLKLDRKYDHTKPDMTILFSLNPEEAERRIEKRLLESGKPKDVFDADMAFAKRVMQNFDNMHFYLREKIERVDANQRIEDVREYVWARVLPTIHTL